MSWFCHVSDDPMPVTLPSSLTTVTCVTSLSHATSTINQPTGLWSGHCVFLLQLTWRCSAYPRTVSPPPLRQLVELHHDLSSTSRPFSVQTKEQALGSMTIGTYNIRLSTSSPGGLVVEVRLT